MCVLKPPANAVYLALSSESVGYLSGTLKDHFQKRMTHDSYTDINEYCQKLTEFIK